MSSLYFVKRVGQSIVVFFIATTIAFILYRMLPFGPLEIITTRLIQQAAESGGSVSASRMEQVHRLVEIYTGINPSQPWYIAYLEYLRSIFFELDLGRSIYMNEPVFQLMMKRMPWSLFISLYGLILGTTVSLIFGALMAYNEGSKFDLGLTAFTVVNTGIPYYIVAIAIVVFFGFYLGWFPTAGRFNPNTTPGFNWPYMAGVVSHAALPIATTFIAGFGGGLAFRGNCIREMGKDYIRVGHLRGISDNRLALRYVGRNSLLPIYTGIMVRISGLFGSSIIIEEIFNYQAMGLLVFQALQNRDYPLLMGAFLFFTAITLISILVADMTYGIIDPRVRGGAERETY